MRKSAVVLATWMLLAAAGCAGHGAVPVVAPESAAGPRVLVAMEGSEFKNAVASRLVERLAARDARVGVVPLSALRDRDPADYDAVLLLNTCRQWSLDSRVVRFLARMEDPGRAVVATTAGDPEWRAEEPGVDAVTSASEMDRAAALADTLAEKLLRAAGR